MPTAPKIFDSGKPGVRRGRRLAAVVSAMAAVCASVVLTSPAHADEVTQACASYHSWTECVAFDYDTQTLSINALNGYSYSQVESLTIKTGGDQSSQGFNIPSHAWRGFSWKHTPEHNVPVFGFIDDVQVVFGYF